MTGDQNKVSSHESHKVLEGLPEGEMNTGNLIGLGETSGFREGSYQIVPVIGEDLA